jgi:EmrB/QacA subfamily drug resistance transporter
MTLAATSPPPDRRRWLTLAIMSLALAIVVIDVTLVNVTIPSIQEAFQAPLRSVEWISALYALVYAAFIITWGKLGDAFGRRRLFVAGVATFVAGSLLVGIANSITLILVGRFVQGMGGAMTSPATLSILSMAFPGPSRGVAFGIWGATAAAAGAVGPLLGGFLTTYFNWRWAFLINLPVGVIAIGGAWLFVDESSDPGSSHKVDLVGIGLASTGLAALVFGLIEGPAYGWWRPLGVFALGRLRWPFQSLAITPALFAAALLLLAAFVAYERRLGRSGGEPLFDFGLLRYKGFRYGLLTVLIVALGEFGLFFILSIFLQTARQLSAFQTGLVFMPFAVVDFAAAPFAGWLSDRIGPKWLVTFGMLCEASGIFLCSRLLDPSIPLARLFPPLMLYGAGVGLTISQLTNITMSDIPAAQSGAGSGANNTVRQLGAAIGIAVLGTVLASGISRIGQEELALRQDIPAAAKPALAQALAEGLAEGIPGTSSSTGAVQGLFAGAVSAGARQAGSIAAGFVLLGACSSLLIPNRSSFPTPRPIAE